MQNLDLASQSCYLWKAFVGKCAEKKRFSNCVVLWRPRLELRKALWQLAWRRSPRCSPARRSLRVWGKTCCSRLCNFGIMYVFANYVSCFVGHHTGWKKTLLTSPWWCPSRPQQWQGLQGHRGGIWERAPLLQGSPLLPVENRVQNLKSQRLLLKM